MFERFNEKAVSVVKLAQEESRRLGHNFVGTEQLLLGLIREGTGIASSILALMGADLQRTRQLVEQAIGRGSEDVKIEMPFTPRAKIALDIAAESSRELGHRYIGTDHLLMGLLREGERAATIIGREPSQSLAIQVLRTLDIDPLAMNYRLMQDQGFGAETQPEQFSLQPSQERLRTLLPPLSDRALKVWHVMSSQLSWEETHAYINRVWIKWLTRLPESDIQSALDELLASGLIERVEFE